MKKYVENNTANTIYVGGMAIAPGEGREVTVPDEPLADTALVTDDQEGDPDADLRALLDGNVASVVASLEGLGKIALTRLQDLETDGKARKGVLSALADAIIALADAALTSDDLGGDDDTKTDGETAADGGTGDGTAAE